MNHICNTRNLKAAVQKATLHASSGMTLINVNRWFIAGKAYLPRKAEDNYTEGSLRDIDNVGALYSVRNLQKEN